MKKGGSKNGKGYVFTHYCINRSHYYKKKKEINLQKMAWSYDHAIFSYIAFLSHILLRTLITGSKPAQQGNPHQYSVEYQGPYGTMRKIMIEHPDILMG